MNRKLSKNKKIHEDFIILHTNITSNNAIVSLTDIYGNVLFWKSCGSLIKNKKKQNPIYLLEQLSFIILDFIFKNKISKVIIKVKGGNKQKLNIFLRPIFFSKLIILNFIDVTKVPFNGCRLPKQSKLKQKKSIFIV